MAKRERVGQIAVASLAFALALVVIGKILERPELLPFWGGLLAAFGEAALVGGLADWFAVRALFTHPFGIPFPHTALIPRNRRRLIGEIRNLVLNEWLPRSVLIQKVQSFDFIGQGVLPVLPALRPHIRDLIRKVLCDVLSGVEPRQIATMLAQGLSTGLDSRQVAPWLAELIRRARHESWLEPILREVVRRLEQWAGAPACRQFLHNRLEHAATMYRERSAWKDLAFTLGEVFGGIDLDEGARAIQAELRRFAAEQIHSGSHLQAMLRDGLFAIERRLRDDPDYLDAMRDLVLNTETLINLFERVLSSIRDETCRQVEAEDSPWVELAMRQVDAWLVRLADDPALRGRLNEWCRHAAIHQLEQHHGLLGTLVEEQMNRLSDEALTELIQARVGEDLNWIRLNGTFVGGLIGVGLYLLVVLVQRLGG
jgi:uncharacterized membrane-anchored protein YjiN (DUF445 family)